MTSEVIDRRPPDPRNRASPAFLPGKPATKIPLPVLVLAAFGALRDRRERGATRSPVLEIRFVVDGERPDPFTTITTFGTAQDVLAAGIRVEHVLPADPRSDALCRALFERAGASGR